MIYETYNSLTDEIMWSIADAITGSRIGVSARSISRYVEVNERRVRISDHISRHHDDDIVYNIDINDFNITEIIDDCCEFCGIEVNDDWKIKDAITSAISALTH